MPFRLLKLSGGTLSLEFETSDLPRVREVIKAAYGKIEIESYPICASVKLGGCEFVFQNEWNDPCLISKTAGGSQILTSLFKHLITPDA